jgi:hypothetical protein
LLTACLLHSVWAWRLWKEAPGIESLASVAIHVGLWVEKKGKGEKGRKK